MDKNICKDECVKSDVKLHRLRMAMRSMKNCTEKRGGGRVDLSRQGFSGCLELCVDQVGLKHTHLPLPLDYWD